MMNREEITAIVDQLFVGNKLARGEVTSHDGTIRVDLRNIRSPIYVLYSWGDDITPPQQALNWILDLYASDDDLVAQGQTIVYCVHPKVGHLGIFVSGAIARKEHAGFVELLDLIEALPPGL
jgi:poly(3-hydroxyalkanoate) synthetase